MKEKEKKLEEFAREYKEKLINKIPERVAKNLQENKDKKLC